MPVCGCLPGGVGSTDAFVVEVRGAEVSPRWCGSVTQFLPGELKVVLLPELDVFGSCLFAFGNDDGVGDDGGGAVVDERQGSD